MPEELVTIAGVRLCLQSFGSRTDPALLLVGGAAASMDWWDVELCELLAAQNLFVTRYDHRDTGRSESSPVGHPSYSTEDLATDPLRILDALGVARAHLVGLSMGGGIGQQLAATRPDRLLTLTLIATSPTGERADQRRLSPPEPRVSTLFESPPPEPRWDERAAVVQYLVDGNRPYAGSLGFDEDRMRRLATIVVDRTADIAASMKNHWLTESAGTDRFRLADIEVPTLVLHGTTDPFFPFDHGQALGAEIAGATLVPLEGMGHEVPPPSLWDVVVPTIRRHTSTVPE